jgi:DNA-binding beta-propeller fold protein YncE
LPVGLAISPDGRYLYATSESVTQTGSEGTLTTINLAEAERDPSKSIISTVWAGCNPVRVVATASAVYVTARASDELLEFSEHALSGDPTSALTGQVRVGEAPVDLAVVDRGKMLVVADSNRFSEGMSSNLALVDIAPTGSLQLAGYIVAGAFARDMTVSPNGQELIVSNYASGQLEEILTKSL